MFWQLEGDGFWWFHTLELTAKLAQRSTGEKGPLEVCVAKSLALCFVVVVVVVVVCFLRTFGNCHGRRHCFVVVLPNLSLFFFLI